MPSSVQGRYEGELHTLSLRAAITILPIEKIQPPDMKRISLMATIGTVTKREPRPRRRTA
jgi:uncharacterized protein (DUF736 family)